MPMRWSDANAMERQRLYKTVMRTVAIRIEKERLGLKPAANAEDRLGVTVKFNCAVEGGPVQRDLVMFVTIPGSPGRRRQHLPHRWQLDASPSGRLFPLGAHTNDGNEDECATL